MMKKSFLWAALTLGFMTLAGCNNKKSEPANADNDTTATTETIISDTTAYGVCMDGAMHSFSLKQEDGKVLQLLKDVGDGDSVSVVFGGLLDGDELAVTYYSSEEEQMNVATRVINLTTLRAHWRSLDRDFEIEKGGTVKSNQQGETHPWATWRIYNGHLLLNADTFDITMLDADSLYLENDKGIYTFARVKEKPAK